MASQIEVVNAALHKLGEQRLSSLTENRETAEIMNEVYDDQRDWLLEQHPWNFAIKRASLASTTTDPIWGYDNAFPLPTDCLRVLNTDRDENDSNAPDWHVESGNIVTNLAAPLFIRYVRQVTSENEMTAQFREVLASRLAAMTASSITGSDVRVAELEQKFQEILGKAKTADGQEGTPGRLRSTSWTAARRAGVRDIM